MTTREIREGMQYQGSQEEIAYRLNTAYCSLNPSTPSTPTVATATISTVTEVNGAVTYTDVTATKMPGSPTISSQYIILPPIKALAAGVLYLVEVKFTLEGNVFVTPASIQGER